MDPWLNWLIGFGVWILCIVFFAAIVFLIVGIREIPLKEINNELFGYKRRSDILPKKGYFLDTHAHTLASDGVLTPEQLIKWHIANGYDAFVLTDHNTDKNNVPILALQDKYPEILIIPGYEWTTMRIHINFLGIKEWDERVPMNPTDEQIRNAIRKAKEMGAIVQVDHITWTIDQPSHRNGNYTHPTRDQLLEWGVDGFEINNEMRWYDPKTIHWLELKKQKNELDRPIFISTGTDVHNPLKEWATGWTQILLKEEEKNYPSWQIIKKALLEARTKIWVDHDYVEPPELNRLKKSLPSNRKKIFAPFFALKHGITHIPGTLGGIIMYVFWFIVAYVPLRLIFAWIFSM
ncbi:MAG: hypothetical protein GF364_07290 [Candidatus Lokiarchaeota archaeon]|nr:hypothetical protein [Candidatus Lokiarchaeota archaeon]